MPPREVRTPIRIKQSVMILVGFRPASLAASVLPPMAYTLRPKRVLARIKPKITMQISITHTETGISRNLALPMAMKAGWLMDSGLPPTMI